MKTVAYDVESALIQAGLLDPPLACVTWCSDDFVPGILHHSEAHDFLEQMFANDQMVGANVSYDFGVCAAKFPDLMPLIFRAYREGRVRDIQLDQNLIDLANGELGGRPGAARYSYSLAALHERYGFGVLDKSGDTWRLRYGELLDVPMSRWPEAAVSYAKDDSVATLRVHRAQLQHSDLIADGPAQARAGWALQLQQIRGMITDARMCDEYLEETKEDIARCKVLLLESGLLRANGTKDTKLAKKRMEDVCREYDLKPKLTDTGGICLDAEATRDSGDPVLRAYSTFTSADKTLTRVVQLREGASGTPLQTSYVIINSNGRTSSREPGAPLKGSNFQNLNRKGKLRQCFTARPGTGLWSVDYGMDELHCVSQCEIWMRGESKLAEALNAKRDVHCEVGSVLVNRSYEDVVAGKKKDPTCKKARQDSKEVNFGGWGCLSPKKLMLRTNLKADDPKERIDFARAKFIMNAWEKRWEPQHYFELCKAMFPHGDSWGLTTMRQFVSGRVRAHVDYPALCNGLFSGLATDAIKYALFCLAEACYLAGPKDALFGTKPLLYVHDEVIGESPRDRLHEASFAAAEIMVSAHNSIYTPDVPVRAEPAAMDFWFKDAEAIYDEAGRLVPWYPDTEEDRQGNKFNLVWAHDGEKKRCVGRTLVGAAPKRSPLLQSLMG